MNMQGKSPFFILIESAHFVFYRLKKGDLPCTASKSRLYYKAGNEVFL